MECSYTMQSSTRKVIGVVGGVGPYAGLDLNQKIFACTRTAREQDHLEVYLLSCSALIADRSEYLLHPESAENPGEAIYGVVEKLSRIGAQAIGIPCNTCHSALIFDVVERRIREDHLPVNLLHMIREVRRHVSRALPSAARIGLLATLGTYHSGIYSSIFAEEGTVEILVPSPEEQKKVHAAIYHPDYGIKNHPNPISKQASGDLADVAHGLVAAGAQGVIMGCTEIPLALRPLSKAIPLIDSTLILARALVEAADPAALLPAAGST
jgi:aspartate racemase